MKDGNQSRYASDEDILTLYNRRDEQAIAATQSKYGSYCRAVADRILRVREDAEECVNDTYLHAWNAIPPDRGVCGHSSAQSCAIWQSTG